MREPRPPLVISEGSSLLKLLPADEGLPASPCDMDVMREMLAGSSAFTNVPPSGTAASGSTTVLPDG